MSNFLTKLERGFESSDHAVVALLKLAGIVIAHKKLISLVSLAYITGVLGLLPHLFWWRWR